MITEAYESRTMRAAELELCECGSVVVDDVRLATALVATAKCAGMCRVAVRPLAGSGYLVEALPRPWLRVLRGGRTE
ncbi:MAG: hypothetical protein Q8R92_01635 [Deltaproteobacteria bacterium]|nr:hypothetical protein [Deltaproteobacteria bacterium]